MLHRCLRCDLTITPSISSHLLYTTRLATQHQATVKFHGVFASHWRSLASAPERNVRRAAPRDSDDLVTPFMHVVIQTTRHYAQSVTSHLVLTVSRRRTTISDCFLASLQGSDYILTFYEECFRRIVSEDSRYLGLTLVFICLASFAIVSRPPFVK